MVTDPPEPHCLIVQPIHEAGLALLEQAGIRPVLAAASDPATVLGQISGMAAVITRNAGLDAAAIAAAPLLRVIAVHGVGTDAVAIEAATRRGIAVTNAPGANLASVAEHAIALTFALAKATVASHEAMRRGDWDFKYRVGLTELAGGLFGVVGFGEIGRATARLAGALGMRVIGWSRSQPDAAFASAGVERCGDLDALLDRADVVSLHLSLSASTKGIIGAPELARMKPSAFLVNTARGALVDEAALVNSLRLEQIAGAGLDVFEREPPTVDSPLLDLPNVVLSPHIAGSTRQAAERTAILAAEQVIAALSGRRPDHLLNPGAWPGAQPAAGLAGG